MNRRPRILGMRRNTLFVLPEIREGWSNELKNALAIRNACATEGRCPDCDAVGEIRADEDYPGIFHYTFHHEPWCGALTDEAAA